MKHGRAMVGGAIIAAWLVGIALLVQKEYFRPRVEQLAQAASRISPAVVFYGVMQGDRQIGFASSTLDTSTTTISLTDYFVADLPVGGKARRATARTSVVLSRALRMTDFDLALTTEGAPVHATGHVDADTVMTLDVASGGDAPDHHRVALTGPVLLPTVVPLVVGLGERLKVGKRYVLPVFDPASMAPRNITFNVRAESLFVVADSAVLDSASGRWRGVRPDTIRAFQITADSSGAGFSGWIDEQGRIVQTVQLGLELRRLPYEVAFENWRKDTTRKTVTEDRDILETTAIAANKRLDRKVGTLRVRLSGADFTHFDLKGEGQQLSHDTLVIQRANEATLAATYELPTPRSIVRRDAYPANSPDARYASPEVLIESANPYIVAKARSIVRRERDPRVVAQRLTEWVHDSIRDRITFGVPSALQVLKTRVGDCNEHTQLFVALARAVGLPARVVAGLAYVDGKFYYHAWPEVKLNDWVPVDPTFGQLPADAAHLRFVVGGLARQTELLRLMGNLRIDVLAVNPPSNSVHSASGPSHR